MIEKLDVNMGNKNLWSDAAKYGTLIALAWIFFQVIAMFLQSSFVMLASWIVYGVLTYTFTKHRAALAGRSIGYSYGQGLVYILCMMLFAGILGAAYEFTASNWLFAAKYEANAAQGMAMLMNTGLYSNEQLDMLASITKSVYHSPFVVLFSNLFRALLKGLFFGLFIAAATKRDPDLFVEESEHDTNA